MTKSLKVDFRVGLPPKKVGRKPGQKDKWPRRAPGSPIPSNNIYIDIEGIVLIDDIEETSSARDIKSIMTLKELKFLEIFLTQDIDRLSAIKLAGYESRSDSYLLFLARKIVVKYESQAQDHRKIFRALGAGEVAIARGLLSIAEDRGNPADVRRKAWADLASCLGLKSEVIESFQGMAIIIRGDDDEPGQPGQPTQKALPPPVRPTQIIK